MRRDPERTLEVDITEMNECGVVVHTCNPWELEAGGPILQYYSQLHSKFEGSLGYVRLCPKEEKIAL